MLLYIYIYIYMFLKFQVLKNIYFEIQILVKYQGTSIMIYFFQEHLSE